MTALALTAGLLGGAAMQPVVSFDEERRVRTDAEAVIVLDTSRSMLARTSAAAVTRFDRAKASATAIRTAIPSVPVGLASITDRTLPHLLPMADERVFVNTLRKAIGIEKPPPVHQLVARVTRLDSLSAVATSGFFSPAARRRVLVVFTDGETLPWRARLGPVFARAGVTTVLIHVWERDGRVFTRGTAEPGYRADPGARETIDRFAATIDADVFSEQELGAAIQTVKRQLGRGPSVVQGERHRDVELAPPLAAAAFLPLLLLLWRRDR